MQERQHGSTLCIFSPQAVIEQGKAYRISIWYYSAIEAILKRSKCRMCRILAARRGLRDPWIHVSTDNTVAIVREEAYLGVARSVRVLVLT
jgi:hypothetical protein